MPPKPKRGGGAAPRPRAAAESARSSSRPRARPAKSKTARKPPPEPTHLAAFREKAERALDLEARHEELRSLQSRLEEGIRAWRTTFDSIDRAICLLDRGQTIVRCNRAMSDLLGKPYQKIIGRHCWELVHGTDAPIEGCPVVRMRQTHSKERAELPVGDRLLDVEVHPVLDPDGTVTGAVHVISDVTKQRLAERQFREQAGTTSVLYAGAQKLSGTLDVSALCEKATSTCVQIFGVDLAQVDRAQPDGRLVTLSRFPADLAHSGQVKQRWDDSPQGRGPAGRAVRSGRPVVVGDLARDKTRVPCRELMKEAGLCTAGAFPLTSGDAALGAITLLSARPGFFSPERVEALQTYANQVAAALDNARLCESLQHELTQRKKSEDALLNRMNDLAILHEASQRFIGLDDEQKTLDSLCTIVVRGLGLRMAWVGLVRQDDFDVHPAASHGFEDDYLSCIRVTWDDSPTGRGPTGRAIRTGKPVPMDDIETDPSYEPWRAQAMARGYRSSASMPLVYQNKVFGILNSYSTEPEYFTQERLQLLQSLANAAAVALQRTHLYAQVKRSAAVLQETVKERTAELAETNTELKAFAYSVSHDLRAPLRAMQGISAALRADYAGRLDEVGQDYTRRIEEAAQRMDLLIQDLLAYSRLTRAEIRLKPVALSAVVAESLASLESEVRERHAEIQVKEPLPEVIGHRATLVQAVSNLVANATTFVARGMKPQVRIWAETRDDRVRLWIVDNGIGIAPEHHERVFRVFERLHGIETYPGTGIGLAIVRKAMTRMDGECGVESALGEGSMFWIELRAKEDG